MKRLIPTGGGPLLVALSALLLAGAPASAAARAPGPPEDGRGPAVLLVVAHPDDEAMFAATVYVITQTLDGDVDLAVVTDGSGGFRYAQLAEPIYGLELTDEEIARHHLPAIRKRELLAAGEIVGLRNYFFLEQYDHAYTEDTDTVLTHVWDAERVRTELARIMERGDYDFVFCHLPIPDFHAHHKAATILALEAAARVPAERRPVVLGSFVGGGDGSGDGIGPEEFSELPGYPITRVRADVPPFTFDRMQPLSEDGRLNYQIIVNWLIAEHKSQGTMQLLMNQGATERFWVFEANPPDAVPRTAGLFERVAAGVPR